MESTSVQVKQAKGELVLKWSIWQWLATCAKDKTPGLIWVEIPSKKSYSSNYLYYKTY
jgi:hypothetical protein